MSTPEHVVVVGGGAAAGNAVVSLREAGWDGHLTVLAAEPHPPYERPSLSKGVLVSGEDPASGFVKPAGFYRDHDVDLRTGDAALALNVGARTVRTDGGELRYDSLPDQHELSMEYVGIVGPGTVDDVVIRGDVSSTTWSAFWLDRDTVVAGMYVNDWDTLGPIRDLVETRRGGVSRQRLADPGCALDDVWL